jgi:NAD+-dependent protein deacetylase sirtuin 7
MAYSCNTRSGRCVKLNKDYVEKYVFKQNQKDLIERIQKIFKKELANRTKEEIDLIENYPEIIKKLEKYKESRDKNKLHQEILIDDLEIIKEKTKKIAELLRSCKYVIVYTGAGISTSASIPDYRGPNGLWTMLSKGIKIQPPDFSQCKPTYSHMVLKNMLKLGLIKHIVSQNCDGLHLRSGIARENLSELHGNCFIEHCPTCSKEYIRLFDVTSNSAFRKHSTGRYCHTCKNSQLQDSIIHFGEKLKDGLPYNWENAKKAIQQADCILCLGTSFKVLRHYKSLWPKKLKNLIIVNIQWTCKDKQSLIKLNSYCDQFMEMLVKELEIEITNEFDYKNEQDPLIDLAIKLQTNEEISLNKNTIDVKSYKENKNDSVITNNWLSKSFKKMK